MQPDDDDLPPWEQERDDEAAFWRDQREHPPQRHHVDDAITASMRTEANTVMCPHCHAPIGTNCHNRNAGRELRGIPCHPIRLTTARKV